MSSQITGLRVAGSVFGLMAFAQLLRVILHPVVRVGGHTIPLWPSILAVLVLTGLALWLLNLAHSHA